MTNQQPTETPTPRTNAIHEKYELHCTTEEVDELYELSSQLEKELAEANKLKDEYYSMFEELRQRFPTGAQVMVYAGLKEKYDELTSRLSSAEQSNVVMREALINIKPEKDCPWCSKADEPCHHCYTMARLQGQVAHALSTPSTNP